MADKWINCIPAKATTGDYARVTYSTKNRIHAIARQFSEYRNAVAFTRKKAIELGEGTEVIIYPQSATWTKVYEVKTGKLVLVGKFT